MVLTDVPNMGLPDLQLVKNTTSLKYNTVKHNKRKYAYIC